MMRTKSPLSPFLIGNVREKKPVPFLYILLCLEGALVSFNLSAMAAMIGPVSLDLGKDSFYVARMISYYMVPYGAGALVFAPLVKKYPIKDIKIICLSVFGLANFVSGISNSLELLFLSRITAGIAASATAPVALILIGQLFEKGIRGRMVGLFFGSTFSSSLLGVFLSGFISWRYIFILPAIFAFINLALVALFFKQGGKQEYNLEVNYIKILKTHRIARIFLYILCLSIVYHGIYNWLGVYFSSLGFLQKTIGLLLSIVGLSGLFGQVCGGWITDKKGRVFAATIGLFILAVSAFLLGLPFGNAAYMALTLFILGSGWTINHNAVSTVLTDFPDSMRPELAGLNSAVRFASGGIGVALAGMFMQKSFMMSFAGLGAVVLCLAMFTDRILNINKVTR